VVQMSPRWLRSLRINLTVLTRGKLDYEKSPSTVSKPNE
jgi:hypothetical protein